MKKVFTLFFTVLLAINLKSQVTVKMDLPTHVLQNSELTVTLKITKGPIRNYSKYEMIVPDGITVKEIDTKYGTFTTQNNKVRIVWAITPADPIYTVSLKFFITSNVGAKQITQTYAYAEKGEKLELEMATVYFNVVDSVGHKAAQNEAAKANAADSTQNSLVSAISPEEVNKEVAQLKVNSAQAIEIAEKDKKLAEARLAEAELAIKQAESISDETKKKEAINLALENKANAEADIANSDKIIVLSRSLNENAVEIEKLNQPIDSGATNPIVTSPISTTPVATVSLTQIEENKPVASEPIVAKSEVSNTSTTNTTELKVETTVQTTPAMPVTVTETNSLVTKNTETAVPIEASIEANNNVNAKITATVSENSISTDTTAKTVAITSLAPTTPTTSDASIHDTKIEHATETAMVKGEQGARGLYKPLKADEAHTPLEIRMQVTQLRLDSKDAKEVGTREKLKAEKELADAFAMAKKAQAIKDPAKKKVALDESAELKEQAQYDLEIASKILALSKSLADNANEIEKLHLSELQNLESQEAQAKAASIAQNEAKPEITNVETKKSPTMVESESKSNSEEIKIPIEKPAIVKEAKVKESKEKIANESSSVSANSSISGEVFTLQLGSFLNSPDLSQFKKLGKVDLKTENGKFKVFYGKYNSKQEATEMRLKTVARGFDCFIVSIKK